MDDAAGFFANVFGGDRFEEYVRERFYLSHVSTNSKIYIDRRDLHYERDDQHRSGDDDRRGEG